jgi:pantoate--beta-alanine ligase
MAQTIEFPNASPPVARTAADLARHVAGWRDAGETVALVPTMGAIHAGHLALAAAAGKDCRRVVASLFVNPTQFGAGEDLAAYPADEATDAGLLAGAGVDLLYAPTVEEMYPQGFATAVTVTGALTEGLCGAHRPTHFAGVATVVAKLLAQCRPDAAWFGEKDYQQLLVVRRLARDLDLDVRIEAVATVRDADGLAISSRNAYLGAAERRIAPLLYRTIQAMAARLSGGGAAAADEIARGTAELLDAGFAAVDYVALCDAETLAPVGRVHRPARVLAAAHLGRTRLIDNVAVE